MLETFSHRIVLSFGWLRAFIALLAGALLALGLAPIGFWPVLFVALPLAIWLIDGAGSGRLGGLFSAGLTGWWFGFGYHLAGLWWIGSAFLVDAEIFGWMLPFAVLLMPAGLALFMALGFALARMLWSTGALRLLAFALALTLAEWLRGHVLTGFPWNAPGQILAGDINMAQGAAVLGLWGLSFLALLAGATPAVLVDSAARRWRIGPLLAAFIALAALYGYGFWRLHVTPAETVAGVRLRIMQPNLPQDQKFNYSAKAAVMRRYLAISDRPTSPAAQGVRDATHLIWPESAFPFFLTREADALAQIAELLPRGTVLITGAARSELVPGTREPKVYNSIYSIDHDGSIIGLYDKVHLVPFGEYLPFQAQLESIGLQQLTRQRGGFAAGSRRKKMSTPGAPPFLPLICYEVIFPGEAVPAGERPGWLLNVTNDGWFGRTSGPYQHFALARLRAIEQGLPLVRAANTGISAVVDPVGRIVKSLPLSVEGVIDAPLPRALTPTIYARTGDLAGFVAWLLLSAFVWRRRSMTP